MSEKGNNSDIQTTMWYAHLAPSALQDAILVIEKPDPINFGKQVVNTENFLPNRSYESKNGAVGSALTQDLG